MILRRYQSSDCEQLAALFYDTVHSVNAKDYDEEQLNAWASGKVDLAAWDASFQEHDTVVAVENDCIVGFGDIDKTGYLDRLYIHKDHQGKGIASAICDELESAFPAEKIVTHASVTAKPFFEKRGYKAVKEQQVERRGIYLTNYIMEKDMGQTVCDDENAPAHTENTMENHEYLIELRNSTGMSRKVFCEYFGIPYRTEQDWELGNRKMPDYLLRLMEYKIKMEKMMKEGQWEK